MYHNQSFFINGEEKGKPFFPDAISAFKILVDESYFHLNDDNELKMYPKNAVAFIYCIAGKGRIYTKHEKYDLNENDCIFLKFYDIAKYKATDAIWNYQWVNFTYSGTMPFKTGKIINKPINDNENKSFDKFIALGNSNESKNIINYALAEYLYNIFEKERITSEQESERQAIRQADDISSFINQKIYSKITVDTVSAFFNISPRRLHQIFSQEMGISPKHYINKKKMEEGYRLLVQTSTPIYKISEMLCFSSPYHFSNEFKKTFGDTPSNVRNMEKN